MAKNDRIQIEVKKLKAKVEELKRKAGPKIEEGKQFVLKEEQEVEKYIRTNPMKSVGVAFAVGFLIGRMGK